MAYDYSSENKRLELPNPYRVENGFLFTCAGMLVVAGLTGLLWARAALQESSLRLGAPPLIVGIAPLLHYGHPAVIGAGWDIETALPPARYIERGPIAAIGQAAQTSWGRLLNATK